MFPHQDRQATRESLLNAAAEAFMEKGYRANIDDIALRAGVVKQTLYNHFPSKDILFAEVIRTSIRSILVTLETEEGDFRSNLIRFATAYREKVLSPTGLSIFRTLVAEAPRLPELAGNFFAEGPRETIRVLSRFLAKAMERSQLRHDDPEFAAEMLTGMLSNYDRLRGLINMETGMLSDTRKTERVVDCFLRAYLPQ